MPGVRSRRPAPRTRRRWPAAAPTSTAAARHKTVRTPLLAALYFCCAEHSDCYLAEALDCVCMCMCKETVTTVASFPRPHSLPGGASLPQGERLLQGGVPEGRARGA